MTIKRKLNSGSPWEEVVGYSRAVRIGNNIEVSGTVSVDNSGELIGNEDAYLQTKFILFRIQHALEQLGGKLTDVIRTRMYVTNISDWEKIAKAHAEVFGEIKPCTTMVEVSQLINPVYLVEIEASAILSDNN